MYLLGQKLQAAGVRFMAASCKHLRDGSMANILITVASEDDAETVRAWSDQEGVDVVIRRATPEEIRSAQQWSE